MATKGDILSARIKQRPILAAAARERAEFEDPFAMSLDFGRNLMEGYQLGQKMVEKGERYLDRQARKKEVGQSSRNFKDYEEYKFYQGLTDESKAFYENPTRVEKSFTQLEARVPDGLNEGESLIDNYTYGEARLALDRDILNNKPADFSDPNRTDAILDAEYEAAKNIIGPKMTDSNSASYNESYAGYTTGNELNIPLGTTMFNIKSILKKPYEYLYGKEPIQEAVASYRRPSIMLPQGISVNR